MDFSTAINYGLKQIERHVADQIYATKVDIPDSLEFLIIKQVLDNYSRNAEDYDTMSLLQQVVDYCIEIEP